MNTSSHPSHLSSHAHEKNQFLIYPAHLALLMEIQKRGLVTNETHHTLWKSLPSCGCLTSFSPDHFEVVVIFLTLPCLALGFCLYSHPVPHLSVRCQMAIADSLICVMTLFPCVFLSLYVLPYALSLCMAGFLILFHLIFLHRRSPRRIRIAYGEKRDLHRLARAARITLPLLA
jgi:hypothetical protein